MRKVWNFLKYTLYFLLAVIVVFLIYCYIPPKQYDISPAAYPWKKGLSETEIDSTARALLAQMSLDEKLDQLHGSSTFLSFAKGGMRWFVLGLGREIGYSGANERLHIPPLAAADGPRGLNVNTATCFPVSMLRGATWDRALERRVGEAMGEESRAYGVNYNLGGCINLLRHPGWGRAQESYGEDSYLLGEMGVPFAQGIQSQNVMACIKHFAANSVENTRNKINVTMDERTLREVYLPHFKKCVDGGAASIMSAYNQVNGAYCGQDKYLLTDILRNEWGFKGYVSSDWILGIYDAEKAANAGMDVEMPIGWRYADLPKLIREGKVSQQTIDEMVLRVLRMKLFYITRTDPKPYPKDLIANAAHCNLAREVAEKGIVLLKNETHLLPLDATTLKSIAIIGPLVTAENTGDHASSYVKPPYIVTLLDGIKAAAGPNVQILTDDGKDPQKAAALAAKADVAILAVGYNFSDEGENLSYNKEFDPNKIWGTGGDRNSLELKSEEQALVKAVAAANKKTVVTLISGSAVLMETWRPEVSAILMAFYPGMEGGNAVANVLFGKVNPSGKLPFSIAKQASDYPFFNGFTDTITYGYYHGYTLFDKEAIEPAFAFGFGMSYTTFQYDHLQLQNVPLTTGDTLQVAVNVTNTGARAGEEVVQAYIGFDNARVDRPKKLLRGFEKILLAPGETKTVVLRIPVSDLAWYNPAAKQWEVEKVQHSVLVGGSSRTGDLLRGVFLVE